MGPDDLPVTSASGGTRAALALVSRRRLLHATLATGVTGLMPRSAAAAGSPIALGSISRTPARQNGGDTLTLVTNRTPSDLDPHSAYDAGSGVLLQGPFEGLIRLKPGNADEYLPVLAESWTANADQSVWTFQLREGVVFHDGTPFDAEAARASFERIFGLGLAPSTVLSRFIDDPGQVSAPASHTLVFGLGRPSPRFETALSSAYGTAIVNVGALGAHEVDGDWGHAWAQANSEGVGTGPYRVVEFDFENGAVLEPFAEYWGGWRDGQFAQVRIRIVVEPETRRALLENGEADIATTMPLGSIRELEQHPDLLIDRRYTLAVTYLAMTVAGPLASPAARQACCWAFPYDEVIEGVYEDFAKRAAGPVAELTRGFDPATFRYETDLERARELLREANVPEGTVLTTLFPAGNQESVTIMELFQANLAQIGITLDIQLVDFATYVGIAFGDMPAEERPSFFPAFWQPDYNDAWNQLWPQISCAAWQNGNVGHYCDERVESLLDMARDAEDPAVYQEAVGEVQQIVTRDDPAAIYLAQAQWLTVLRRDVGGFEPDLVAAGLFDFYALHRLTIEAEAP
jgi:ABC-type transport system substrate-binding protein